MLTGDTGLDLCNYCERVRFDGGANFCGHHNNSTPCAGFLVKRDLSEEQVQKLRQEIHGMIGELEAKLIRGNPHLFTSYQNQLHRWDLIREMLMKHEVSMTR